MKALVTLTVVMGVLIVGGVITLGVVVTKRMSAPATAQAVVLDEPAGTTIADVSGVGDRVALLLRGAGPDRVVVVDARTGAVMSRVGLAH